MSARGWAERWRALLPGEVENRRARSQGIAWARAGRVSDLRPHGGALTGRVQGARATPFLVEVEIPRLDDEGWRAVAETVASRARHEAQLLAGHVPDGLPGDLERQGVRLFPEASEVTVGCPCGREREPCEHVTALWEAAADRFAHDPFAWLRIRGRGRERLLGEIAAARRRATAGRGAEPGAGVPLAGLHGRAWTRARGPVEDAAVAVPREAAEEDIEAAAGPVRLLGDPPGWEGGVSAGDLFAPLVARAAAYAAATWASSDRSTARGDADR